MTVHGPAVSHVLITNDDGINAPGLEVLEAVAETLAREVWVVAPEHDQSGVSHSISLHAPLRVRSLGDRRFSVTGTPGDCVIVGSRNVLPAPPDLVLSGVNRGANLGVETVFSGTVGAAMTGLLLGLPSLRSAKPFPIARGALGHSTPAGTWCTPEAAKGRLGPWCVPERKLP